MLRSKELYFCVNIYHSFRPAIDTSLSFPILSTGGAPQTNVFVAGSNSWGNRSCNNEATTPRGLSSPTDAARTSTTGEKDVIGGAVEGSVTFVTPDAACASASCPFFSLSSSSRLLTCAPDRASSLASSSASSNTSCLTAPIE